MSERKPNRYFLIDNSFYCLQCLMDEPENGTEMEDLVGVNCCNCGRDEYNNPDATRPGYAVQGDFHYTD